MCPTGIAIDTPGPISVISSRSSDLRHIRPLPARKYQTSSTVRCATALDTAPVASVNNAMLPRVALQRRRTSAPSGAIASGAAARFFVANGCIRSNQFLTIIA
jgi:hypothetical protein